MKLEKNTADYLLEAGQDASIAVVVRDKSFTYGELRYACARLASTLAKIGVIPGDRIGILGIGTGHKTRFR